MRPPITSVNVRGRICMGKRRHINDESNIAVDQFWSIVLSVISFSFSLCCSIASQRGVGNLRVTIH